LFIFVCTKAHHVCPLGYQVFKVIFMSDFPIKSRYPFSSASYVLHVSPTFYSRFDHLHNIG
jgi:hypothetical protein